MIRWDGRNNRWRWEFDRFIDGLRVRRSKLLPSGISEEQATAIGMTMEADIYTKTKLVAQSDEWESYVAGMLADKKSWINEQVIRTKSRAKVSGLAGNLAHQDVADLLLRSRGRCEVTGIRFQLGKPERARSKPFFHSIDRIDCGRGYEPWNCRVVCFGVNLAMSNWGEAVFAELATGYVVNRYCAISILNRGQISPNRPRTEVGEVADGAGFEPT